MYIINITIFGYFCSTQSYDPQRSFFSPTWSPLFQGGNSLARVLRKRKGRKRGLDKSWRNWMATMCQANGYPWILNSDMNFSRKHLKQLPRRMPRFSQEASCKSSSQEAATTTWPKLRELSCHLTLKDQASQQVKCFIDALSYRFFFTLKYANRPLPQFFKRDSIRIKWPCASQIHDEVQSGKLMDYKWPMAAPYSW